MRKGSEREPTATLIGPNIALRAPLPSDVADRRALGRDPEIVRMFGGDRPATTDMTDAAAERWYGRIAADPNPHHWVVDFDGRCIGSASLHSLDEHDRRARFAIGILDPSLLGRGLGTEATRLILHFAFEELDLHRVDLRVIAYNARAIAAYRKCGFVEEGRERDAVCVDGEYHDDVMMSILAHEYAAIAPTW